MKSSDVEVLRARIAEKIEGIGPGYFVAIAGKPHEWRALLDLASSALSEQGAKTPRLDETWKAEGQSRLTGDPSDLYSVPMPRSES